MSHTSDLIQKVETFGAHNYHPLPLVLQRGKGARVWDVEGNEYLDFLACYSALNFGHAHPRLIATLKEQAEKLAVCSRAFHSEELSLFCEEITQFCGMEMVLAMNSGSEAVETALKIARKWGYEKKGVRANHAKIIVADNNFHGRTISIISFSSEPGYRDGFGPFTPGFESVPFGDVAAIKAKIDADTVAVFLEPIQAEAGILLPPTGYLAQVKALCEAKNVLFILDEIQTGFGRTGKDFCFQHENIKPDLLVLGKSLGGGLLPLSAVVGRRDVLEVIRPGQHGSTFGGNPLACALGRTVLKVMRDEQFSQKAEKIGNVIRQELSREALPLVTEVRGKGALIGIELDSKAGGARRYCEALYQKGVLCKETHDNVIRIAPPLVISLEEALAGTKKIGDTIRQLARGANQ